MPLSRGVFSHLRVIKFEGYQFQDLFKQLCLLPLIHYHFGYSCQELPTNFSNLVGQIATQISSCQYQIPRLNVRLGQIPNFSIRGIFDSSPTQSNSIQFLSLITIASDSDSLSISSFMAWYEPITSIYWECQYLHVKITPDMDSTYPISPCLN